MELGRAVEPVGREPAPRPLPGEQALKTNEGDEALIEDEVDEEKEMAIKKEETNEKVKEVLQQ